jgi:hypothetical protein
MQTVPVSTGAEVEIISAYCAAMQVISAVTPGPGWTVIGAFYMPTGATVKLEGIGLVSVITNNLTFRLYDVALAAAVSGSTTDANISTSDVRRLSGAFDLAGGKVYQMQAQVIGPSGNGTVRSASLVNS